MTQNQSSTIDNQGTVGLNENGLSASLYQLSTTLTFNDRLGNILCRMSNTFRMKYKISPGLYATGNPDQNSPVLVSCNYRLSLNMIRSVLGGRNVWILVVDTKGINVWCAAGKGTFCSTEIARQAAACNLKSRIKHQTLILPQLGASGVSVSKLHKISGFTVKFGSVRAADIPAYLDNNFTATLAMRRVNFSLFDRAVLIPMELFPAFRMTGFFLLVTTILFGATPEGIIYKKAFSGVLPFAVAALTAVFTGSLLTPLILPMIPGRAFSLKGFIMGLLGAVVIIAMYPRHLYSHQYALFCMVAVPSFSSYLAFLFTGSTTYTSPSGVKTELKIAWPFYIGSAAISLVVLVILLIRFWRFS